MLSDVDIAEDRDPVGAETAASEPSAEPGGISLDQVVGLVMAVLGLRFGLTSLHDNSFMTHLATGRLILDSGSVPSVDPYSFTALGTPWTVQSWGASVIFAALDQTVGPVGIRILVGLCSASIAWLAWRLTSRAGGLVGRLAVAVPVMCIGSKLWVERPLIFSLLLLLAVLFALEDRLDARWMVPVLWLWVNVHGSFPIGLLAIAAYGAGRLLDRERPTVELRVAGWAALGTVLGGVLSPVGVDLLTFPFDLLGRREVFAGIVEWQPPAWDDIGELFFAVQLALAAGLILLRGRRWRNVVPVVIFAALSLQSTRNIVHASLIFIPAMAAAAAGLGSIDGSVPRRALRPVAAGVLALGLVVAVVGLRAPDYDLQDYPVEAVASLRERDLLGPDDRLVTRDFVGNYLEWAYGPEQVRVFMDDRVDMYPVEVISSYTSLIDPDGDYAAVLEGYEASVVVWDLDSPFGDWLEDPDNGWQIIHRDDLWIAAVPRAI
jgi:hypothetical protein